MTSVCTYNNVLFVWHSARNNSNDCAFYTSISGYRLRIFRQLFSAFYTHIRVYIYTSIYVLFFVLFKKQPKYRFRVFKLENNNTSVLHSYFITINLVFNMFTLIRYARDIVHHNLFSHYVIHHKCS